MTPLSDALGPLHTKHLGAFLAVYEEGSLTRAGERLRRAQSAVSRAVHELEASLGVALFERGTRGMLPTDFGKVLRHYTERAFDEMARARQVLQDGRPGAAARASPLYSLSISGRRVGVLSSFAQRRHMGEVARVLGISQPAVSMAVRDLEQAAGVPLFERSAAGLRLNEAGERLLLHVKRALAELRLARDEIAALQGVVRGRITVGALPFGRPWILPAAIGRLLATHPTLQVATREGPIETLVAGLQCGDIDFVLGALRPEVRHTDLVREDLFHDTLAVIARAGHPLARCRPAAFPAALSAAWVLPPQGSPTREALEAALAGLGLAHPRVAVESTDLSIIRGLLLDTDMVTAASRHLFRHELRAGTLVTLPVPLPQAARLIGILRRPNEHASPGAQRLMEEIRALRSLPDEVMG